ncbi:Adenylate kinase [Candidatus Providencia siddallii]|uniref:Adenylate kinase n=1 Tax=Candidatus Providencia siddallii TaxID=1715285 RepID=A0A0M6WAJ4_9GAMM|nr:Adenylate kinase [Candidatus Providencia siddallii]
MHIVLLGAPGSGKGTQAQFLNKKFNIDHISTGEILRVAVNSKNNLNLKINNLMNNGKLVSDELVISLIKERINQNNYARGILFDGFPRTISQANAMKEAFIRIDYVFEFIIPDEIIVKRIIGRRVHASSGRIYHVTFNPPKNKDKDDVTGEKLVIRNDDNEMIIRKRLIEYYKSTTPLIAYYQKEAKKHKIKYFKLDANRKAFEVNEELIKILSYR